MGKFDVDKANRDLKKTGKPPAWVTEHLRMYRESGGAEGHLFDATIAGVPFLRIASHNRSANDGALTEFRPTRAACSRCSRVRSSLGRA